MLRFAESRIEMPYLGTPNIPAAAFRALAQGGVMLMNKIIELLEPHSKSGDLISSWKVEALGSDAIVVFSTDPASIYLDRGTPAHSIPHSPKPKGKWLRFEVDSEFDPTSGESFGEEVFAKQVQHPGTRGIYYIEQAEEEILPMIREMLNEYVVQEIIREVPVFESVPFTGAERSPRTGRFYYGRRGAGGRFTKRLG